MPLESWFPFDFLGLLSLATGSLVGSPWIELRDGHGNLTRRVHRRVNVSPYFKSRRHIVSNIGRLLERAMGSEYFGEEQQRERLLVAILRIVRNRNPYQTVDDQLNHLCRTLEMLWETCIPKAQKRRRLYQELDGRWQERIKPVIDSAAIEIQTVQQRAHQAEARHDAEVIERLRRRLVNNVLYGSPSFGEKLEELMAWSRIAFPDLDVIEVSDYVSGTKRGKDAWLADLNKSRNTTTHMAYHDFRRDRNELEKVRLTWHLEDLLIRMILTLLGYDRDYWPTVALDHGSQPINWVRLDRGVEQFGYERR